MSQIFQQLYTPKVSVNYCLRHTMPLSYLLLFLQCYIVTLTLQSSVRAEIASATDVSGALLNNFANSRCSMANYNDDIEDLDLDVPVNIAFEKRQKKRFILYLNQSTPLTITFSQNVGRKMYFNQTTNLSRSMKTDQRTVLLPCALRGQYDLCVQAKHRGSIKIEAHAAHPQANWPLLNRTNRVTIRSQNRVRKRQMIVKWDKSKFDFHAVQYCLVVSTRNAHTNFCTAVNEFYTSGSRRSTIAGPLASVMDNIWLRPPERAKKIDPHNTNIICTGSRTQQVLRGLSSNNTYYLDVFGVHTKRQNLTFHIASTLVQFNRTHPTALRPNVLSIEKLNGLHGIQVFSFKIPYSSATVDYRQRQPQPLTQTRLQLRYLILPCSGSEINATILRQRKVIGNVGSIYRPTYIKLPTVHEGERYIVRFLPSNEDEMLRANKVGLAITTTQVFNHLPELPENITIFEVRSHCTSTTIAWYSSPEIRSTSYCIIVFNLPQRNRSSIDYTNYCLDFGKRIVQHPHFYSMECTEKAKSPPTLETHTIFNLQPSETYLIYVTVNLSEGKPLPYQSLKVRTQQACREEMAEIQTADY